MRLVPQVQVTEEGDLGTMVGLLIEQDPDHLAGGLRLTQVARSRLEQRVVGGGLEPAADRSATRLPEVHRPRRGAGHLQAGKGASARSEGVLPVHLVVGDQVDEPPGDGRDRSGRRGREVVVVGLATGAVGVEPHAPGVTDRLPEVLLVGQSGTASLQPRGRNLPGVRSRSTATDAMAGT